MSEADYEGLIAEIERVPPYARLDFTASKTAAFVALSLSEWKQVKAALLQAARPKALPEGMREGSSVDESGGSPAQEPAKSDGPHSDGWRDIASAPRNGTPFLATNGDDTTYVCFRHNPSSLTDEILTSPGRWQFRTAKRWMPLPPPPAEHTQREGER